MAATSDELIKQGDTKRILYSAKNFNETRTVTAIPINPSGTAQTAINFTHVDEGVYQSDWDSTTQALGNWIFVILEDGTNKAFIKLQVVDGATLNDTIYEGMDTLLDSIQTDTTSIETKVDTAIADIATVDGIVDTINTTTTNIETDTQSIETKVDTIDGIVDSIQVDTTAIIADLDNGTDGLGALSADIATLQSSVSGLSNNADAKIALVDTMLIPSASSTDYKLFFRFYSENSADGMEDPDDQDAGAEQAMVNIAVENSAGTDRSGNLTGLSASTQDAKDWMIRESEGVFSAVYNVDNADAVENLIFSFDILEGAVAKSFAAQSRTAGSSDDYTSRFDTLDSSVSVVDSNVDQLLLDVAENQTDLDTIITNVGTVDTVVDGITTTLGTPTDTDIATDIANVATQVTTVDGIVDDILVDTGTTIPATLGSPAGADLATDIAAIKTVVDAINLETDSGGIAI